MKFSCRVLLIIVLACHIQCQMKDDKDKSETLSIINANAASDGIYCSFNGSIKADNVTPNNLYLELIFTQENFENGRKLANLLQAAYSDNGRFFVFEIQFRISQVSSVTLRIKNSLVILKFTLNIEGLAIDFKFIIFKSDNQSQIIDLFQSAV